MTENYTVSYSEEALNDLREIHTYIADELLVPETATAQVRRIRKEVRSLDFMPARYALVEWEPWHSMGMHQLPVNNFIKKKGLSHDQIEKSGCTAAFLSEKRKKLGSGRVFLNYDVL